MSVRELLIDTFAYIPPNRAIEALTSADAERRIAGAPHSVAEIVAHLTFWQSWFTRRAQGAAEPMVASAAQGWPSVAPGSWNGLQSQFLSGLDTLAALGDSPDRLGARLAPPIEFPPLAHYTLRDVLTHVAVHNAHHLGQVVVLRQMMGVWPPPSGSWTF
jgi:uncharacterized damage-inducible protein DinB